MFNSNTTYFNDSNALIIHYSNRIDVDDMMTWNTTLPKRTKHIFIMSFHDVQNVDLQVLGRFWLNGIFITHNLDASPYFLGWHRASNGKIVDLYPFTSWEHIISKTHSTIVQIFFDRLIDLSHAELFVIAYSMPPILINITNVHGTEWCVIGKEMTLAQIVAEQMNATIHEYLLKFSSFENANANADSDYVRLALLEEHGYPLQTFDTLKVTTNQSAISLTDGVQLDPIEMMYEHNSIILTIVLLDFDFGHDRAASHGEQKTVFAFYDSKNHYVTTMRLQIQLFVFFGLIVLLFSCIGFWIKAMRNNSAYPNYISLITDWFDALTDTMARVLSQPVKCPSSLVYIERYVHILQSALAMLCSMVFTGILLNNCLMTDNTQMRTLEDLNVSGIPIIVGDIFESRSSWLKETCV